MLPTFAAPSLAGRSSRRWIWSGASASPGATSCRGRCRSAVSPSCVRSRAMPTTAPRSGGSTCVAPQPIPGEGSWEPAATMPPERFSGTPAAEVAKLRLDMTRPHLIVTEGLARLPGSEGERFVELFRHGTLSIELYAPRGTDPQEPHSRDEVYAVACG